MCDCIKKFEKKMVGREHKGKKITRAVFVTAAIMLDDFGTRAAGEMELDVEGGKRPQKQNVIYSYCPFCGVKYPELKD